MQHHSSKPESRDFTDREMRCVNRIFERMNLAYGRDFLFKFEGLNMDFVKASWAIELDIDGEKKEQAIGWALGNLPERVPNAMEFKKLTFQAPVWRDSAVKFLPEPAADPARVAAVLAGVDRSPSNQGPKDWAHAAIERHKKGEYVGFALLTSARQALRIGSTA